MITNCISIASNSHPESNYRVIKLCNRAAASACEIFTILCDCHRGIPINTQDYVCITNRMQNSGMEVPLNLQHKYD